MTEPTTLKKGQEVVLTADAAAFEGGCVARHEGMVVFVSGCVPGDTVRARVFKKKKRFAYARTLAVLEPSADRVDAPCDYFSDCGGCKWQNLRYDEQLRWKRQHVVDAFERIARLENTEVRGTIGCAEEYYYRNKMEFSFGTSRWLSDQEIASQEEFNREFALGLHVPGRFDKVLDVHRCWLQSETSNSIVNATRAWALEHDLPAYDFRSHEGLLRNLVIRTARATGELMVILVTSDDADEVIDSFVEIVRETVPAVTTIVQAINRGRAQVAFSEETRILHGPGTITERIAGNAFSISPFSFFQTNSLQGEVLYREALTAAAIASDDEVWDLYCGAGTITLAAARTARHVTGIELNEGAVADAWRNARTNGIDNADFIAGDLKGVLTGGAPPPPPRTVITDPPRAGMHQDVLRHILAVAPERIAYVSCNPTTQARDCGLLADAYDVEYVQPVDMFPQTYHIETVARLVRRV